ncbi:MAG TPA: hypothetical protein VJN95_13835 [Gemmatimonadales bacterium]|nr:hypothetical protein [Gemmatimonadales bacterium]
MSFAQSRVLPVMLIAGLSLAACNTPRAETASGGPSSGTTSSGAPADSASLKLAAEKDSLLREVTENAQLMSQISSELAKVKDKKGQMPVVAREGVPTYRDSVLAKIRELSTRVNESESRLATSRRRIAALSTGSDSLKSQVASLQTMVDNFQSAINDQKNTIESLNQQLGALQDENRTLTEEKSALTDTVATLVTEKHRIWYVIGTKDSLKAHGLVAEEGSKFLFFGSKALVPARELDPAQFTEADRRDLIQLTFPDSTKNYRIVSRQDLSGLMNPPAKDGKLKGGIGIADPAKFWAPSPYLIIAED